MRVRHSELFEKRKPNYYKMQSNYFKLEICLQLVIILLQGWLYWI